MKLNEIYDELISIAKKSGITVRRESGSFKSGYCMINDQEFIIINKTSSIEAAAALIAGCLSRHNIDDVFIKPAVREYIEKEASSAAESDYLEIKY